MSLSLFAVASVVVRRPNKLSTIPLLPCLAACTASHRAGLMPALYLAPILLSLFDIMSVISNMDLPLICAGSTASYRIVLIVLALVASARMHRNAHHPANLSNIPRFYNGTYRHRTDAIQRPCPRQ